MMRKTPELRRHEKAFLIALLLIGVVGVALIAALVYVLWKGSF